MGKELLTKPVLGTLATKIDERQELLERGVRITLQTALEQGDALHKAKAGLKHGQFREWCQANIRLGKSQINTYMRLSAANKKKALSPEILFASSIKGMLTCDEIEEDAPPAKPRDDVPPTPAAPKPKQAKVDKAIAEGKERFQFVLAEIQRMRREMKRLRASPLGACINLQAVDADLKNAYTAVTSAMPYARCPYCTKPDGRFEGCKACGRRGWVSKIVHAQAPSDLKRMAKEVKN